MDIKLVFCSVVSLCLWIQCSQFFDLMYATEHAHWRENLALTRGVIGMKGYLWCLFCGSYLLIQAQVVQTRVEIVTGSFFSLY